MAMSLDCPEITLDKLGPKDPPARAPQDTAIMVVPSEDTRLSKGPSLLSRAEIDKVYERFVSGAVSLSEVAILLERPVVETLMLLRKSGLLRARKTYADFHITDSVRQARLTAASNRMSTIKDHIAAGLMLERAVSKKIESLLGPDNEAIEDVKPSDLKMLGDALASAANVRARAVGLSNRGDVEPEEEPVSQLGTGNTFVFNAAPGKPVGPEPEAIDV